MIWLSWRLQRSETLLALAAFGLIAAIFVPAGIHLASAFTHYGVGHCIDRQSRACADGVGAFADSAGTLRSALGWFNLLPGLIGVALAAPLVLDLESGTSTFAWTQGVTRRRWLATKLGIALLTAVAAGGAYTALFGWYRGPFNRVFGRFSDGGFDFQGTVPIAYFLFALGLGLAVGVLWRRTAPAMVVAFLAYFGARITVDQSLRRHFLAPLTATTGFRSGGLNLQRDLQRAWILFEGPSNRAGQPFSGSFQALQRCGNANPGGLKSVSHACLARLGAGYNHAVYFPESRFWAFQGIETALFGGIALLLIAFAAWRVLRAD
jgi:hypothetical protein